MGTLYVSKLYGHPICVQTIWTPYMCPNYMDTLYVSKHYGHPMCPDFMDTLYIYNYVKKYVSGHRCDI